MKKLTIAALAATLATSAIAFAATADRMAMGDTNADGTLTRAEATAAAEARFAKLDVNSDGKLDSADRAAHTSQMFDKMDTDKNGSISRDEFNAMHANRGSGMKGHAGMEHGGMAHGGKMGGHKGGGMMMLMGADTNKDGAVTKAEFTAAQTARFDRADANKDGSISAAEREAAREQMRKAWKDHRAAMPAG